MMNGMTNCQYARYMLLIQAHTKSHLVEKRLEKKNNLKSNKLSFRKNVSISSKHKKM